MSQTAPKIKMMHVGSLKAHERNSRTHTPEQIAKIAAAIKELGFLNPVVVAGDVILAGHARCAAVKTLPPEFHKVPTIDASHLSDAQQRAYIIADNRLTEDAGWDNAVLREEFAFLKSADFEINLTGFDDSQLKMLGAEDAYSPVLQPMKGSNVVTGAEVDKAQEALDGRYAEAGKQALVTCTCPYCGEDFELNKDNL